MALVNMIQPQFGNKMIPFGKRNGQRCAATIFIDRYEVLTSVVLKQGTHSAMLHSIMEWHIAFYSLLHEPTFCHSASMGQRIAFQRYSVFASVMLLCFRNGELRGWRDAEF